MAEASLKSITRQQAAIRLAQHIAYRILSTGLDPVAHTRDFELLWIESEYSEAIQEAGSLDDEKYLAESGWQSADEFREHARGVLIELLRNSDPKMTGLPSDSGC